MHLHCNLVLLLQIIPNYLQFSQQEEIQNVSVEPTLSVESTMLLAEFMFLVTMLSVELAFVATVLSIKSTSMAPLCLVVYYLVHASIQQFFSIKTRFLISLVIIFIIKHSFSLQYCKF